MIRLKKIVVLILALLVANPAKGMDLIPLQALPMVFAGCLIVWKKVTEYLSNKRLDKIDGRLTNLEGGQIRLEDGQTAIQESVTAVGTKVEGVENRLMRKFIEDAAEIVKKSQEDHQATRNAVHTEIEDAKTELLETLLNNSAQLKKLIMSLNKKNEADHQATRDDISTRFGNLKTLIELSEIRNKKDFDVLEKLIDQQTTEIYAHIKAQDENFAQWRAEQREDRKKLAEIHAFVRAYKAREEIDDEGDDIDEFVNSPQTNNRIRIKFAPEDPTIILQRRSQSFNNISRNAFDRKFTITSGAGK